MGRFKVGRIVIGGRWNRGTQIRRSRDLPKPWHRCALFPRGSARCCVTLTGAKMIRVPIRASQWPDVETLTGAEQCPHCCKRGRA